MKHLSAAARRTVTAWLLAAPVLAGALVFFAVPFALSLWYSVTFGVGGAKFVGLANYLDVFSSSAFRLAAGNTLRFLGIGVPSILVLSFVLALLIHRRFSGSQLFRTVLLFPMTVPVAGVVMVVQVFFGAGGVVNGWLARRQDWMNSPAAFWILLGLYIWRNCGYNVILLLAGLNMIPGELYQSAAIEGAGGVQKFVRITLPLMWPSLFFTFVISVTNSFKSYREAFLLGGNHPHDSIYLLQHFLNNNFENLNYQRLSVAATLLFALIFGLVGVLYWLQDRYGEDSV